MQQGKDGSALSEGARRGASWGTARSDGAATSADFHFLRRFNRTSSTLKCSPYRFDGAQRARGIACAWRRGWGWG